MCTHHHTNRKQYLPSSGEADLWVGYLLRREAQWENYASFVVYSEKRGHKDLLVGKEQKNENHFCICSVTQIHVICKQKDASWKFLYQLYGISLLHYL